MRATVATSIRRALLPYQRGKQVALAGAIWLVTAEQRLARGVGAICKSARILKSHSFLVFLKPFSSFLDVIAHGRTALRAEPEMLPEWPMVDGICSHPRMKVKEAYGY
jgi:hypothetical protein